MTRRFEKVSAGEELPAMERVVTREDVKAYADASGDQNPLHQNEEAARAAGFPGIIAHGMFTLGHLTSCVVAWAGDAAALARIRAQFRAPVFVGETIVAGGTVKALDPERRTATLDVWVTLEREGAVEWPIRRGEAEVRLA
jgi:acyl dehydratase